MHCRIMSKRLQLKWVGMSNNTNTITINVSESAQKTNCSNKLLFRVPDNDKMADKLFSAAMSAQAQKISIVFGYEENDCLNNGTVPRTFRIGS